MHAQPTCSSTSFCEHEATASDGREISPKTSITYTHNGRRKGQGPLIKPSPREKSADDARYQRDLMVTDGSQQMTRLRSPREQSSFAVMWKMPNTDHGCEGCEATTHRLLRQACSEVNDGALLGKNNRLCAQTTKREAAS